MTASSRPADALPDVLRRAVLDAPADAAGDVIAGVVRCELEADAVTVRLVDRAGLVLHAVGRDAAPDRAAVDREGSWWALGEIARGALRDVVHREADDDGPAEVHVPLAVRGDHQGVLSVEGARVVPDDERLRDLGELAALLAVEAFRATDHYEVHRRSVSFSVSAELQWQLLPPTSLVDDGVEVHALIEPAPRVTSDLFDWSLDGDRLWLAVLDARGRGLSAAMPAALTMAALRHARRAGSTLADQVALADQVVYDRFRGDAVVRAVVAELDLAAGTAHAVRAGDDETAPRVLRRRDGRAEEVVVEAQEGLGALDRSPYRAGAIDVGAGDDLLVVSDGGTGALGPAGEPFGVARTAGSFAAPGPLREVPRRLLDALRHHAPGEAAQDATVLVAGWRAAAGTGGSQDASGSAGPPGSSVPSEPLGSSR